MASYQMHGGVAVVTLTGVREAGEFEWGTKKAEHRWNPVTVGALARALDEAEAAQANDECFALVVTAEGKFWSNGMDLLFLDAHSADTNQQLEADLTDVMARILTFPMPTIAAFNGHWCAAGGMMGLAFDYRVMNSGKGFFFVPGVDLGIVYSAFQTELMMAKLPHSMHQDVIIYNNKRWTAAELKEQGVVHVLTPPSDVLAAAIELANQLQSKGKGPAKTAIGSIKKGVYRRVLEAMHLEGENSMGYGGRKKGVDRAPPPKLGDELKLKARL